ncbi:MAG: TrkH family potassium uptake protein [Spirochaetaceae bacterium]|nr:MAG: TrkH family potassium uptake protein [Spirochaetaceae bacterium]
MNIQSLIRSTMAVCAGLALVYLPPLAVALVSNEGWIAFGLPFAALALIGLAGLVIGFKSRVPLGPREGVAIVVVTWVVACVSGAFPFLISGVTTSVTDALFESASGFTTTGSTIFADVESLPRSILFWRSLTHWLGGMGILVLAVAILPALGIGGFQLLRAEAPGPDVERLAPRIAHTARAFWGIYAGLTAVEVALLMLGGMDLFDAVNHSFATLATGGFSTRNASIAAYQSPFIEWVVSAFMILSGVNFALYYRALIREFRRIANDTELKTYVGFLVISVTIVTLALIVSRTYADVGESLRYATFQVATLTTSTGFATADYVVWPGIARGVLFLALLIGGCVGSTSGGVKMLHVATLGKIVGRQVLQLAHPRAVVTIKINKTPVNQRTESSIVGFFVLYLFVVALSTLVVASSGTDLETALTATLAVIGNVGPGFGQVGPTLNFAFLPDYVKLTLSAVMLIGRLEIYTVAVLFIPGYLRGW